MVQKNINWLVISLAAYGSEEYKLAGYYISSCLCSLKGGKQPYKLRLSDQAMVVLMSKFQE